MARRFPVVFAFLSAALALGGALSAYGEIAPYFAMGTTTTGKADSLRAGAQPGHSLSSRRMYLDDCRSVAVSPLVIVQSAENRNTLFEACRRLAAGVTAEMPSFAEAWLLAAEMNMALGDPAAFNASLSQSRRLARHVHWLAAARVLLGEDHYDLLDEENVAGQIDDMMSLSTGNTGLAALAGTYVRFPDARERITVSLDGSPPEVQAQFLEMVRTTMNTVRGPS